MLRPLRVLLVFVAVLLAASVFTASAPADDDDDDGGAPPQLIDRTFGDGTAAFTGVPGESTFNFDVSSGPNGEAVVGFADLTSVFGVHFFGPATCLRVSGNRATFEIDNVNITGDVVVFVGDRGTPSGVPEDDEFNFHPIAMADGVCPDPSSMFTEQSVTSGDIVVRDNVAAPRGGDDDDDEDEDEDDEDDEDDDDDD